MVGNAADNLNSDIIGKHSAEILDYSKLYCYTNIGKPNSIFSPVSAQEFCGSVVQNPCQASCQLRPTPNTCIAEGW
jgi:hypothetical protein